MQKRNRSKSGSFYVKSLAEFYSAEGIRKAAEPPTAAQAFAHGAERKKLSRKRLHRFLEAILRRQTGRDSLSTSDSTRP